jgi:hypothetical protein
MGTHNDTSIYDQQASALLRRRAELLRQPETILPTRLYSIFNAKK